MGRFKLKYWTKDSALTSLDGGKRACIASVYFEAVEQDYGAGDAFAVFNFDA